MNLSHDELVALTGYRQHARQLRWLRERLKLSPPLRADGLPVVTRVQVEAAVSGRQVAANGPRWSKAA